MSQNVTAMSKRSLYVTVAILTIIPFVALAIVPTYVRTNPEVGGLPFFYWYQLLWLFLAAAFFLAAALLYNRYGGE
ncbi:MAG: DUF3311 domain-containing protein [Candidatus Thermoplasmatota archaeon]|jgi:hypothetical protein|nr:DUF3311 domain-containing protein [Candidatus Thermoplasmatota archaeon]MCL5789974.1 DUF3311 domain-containing protein [Candidatus Thermoplasmatota archaeon]